MATITKRPRNTSKPWAVRYRDASGKQREQAFKLKSQASAYKIKVEAELQQGTFVDPRQQRDTFTEAATRWLERHPVTAGTKRAYGSVLRNWITPAVGGRLLRHVAQDRDAVADLLNVTMLHLSTERRGMAQAIITGVLDDAVKSGKLPAHRCAGIRLAPGQHAPGRDDFVFPSHEQLQQLASQLPGNLSLTVWLMRGCGLRISEALAVRKQSFRANGTTLRVNEQVKEDGNGTMPLKHRATGAWRDIPVPGYVWAMVRDLPDGYLFIRQSGRFPIYRSYLKAFTTARDTVGIADGFTPHSLRHAFASALLAAGVPLSDVAEHLGHASIDVTYRTYSHLIPTAWGKAREALDAEYDALRSEAP